MEIVLATGNLHKRREIAEILADHTIILPSELGLSFDYDEKGTTYIENAVGKALALYGKLGRPVIADDSGISVPALGGEPGVYSARYGSNGGRNEMNDVDRLELLLANMQGVTDRRAFYVCCMVLVLEEYRFFVAQETLHGEIGTRAIGTGGFGYDPIFILPESGLTVAQISAAEKNGISHRGRAGKRIGEIIGALTAELR